jgi:uncharacterized protein YndB with AHSA1/START domain
MTSLPAPSPDAARLERTYDASAELIWELWTTANGLEGWFAPDGFDTRVTELTLRPGGLLRYSMTAVAPEQVAFMRDTGNPLSIEVRKTFTEVAPPTRLAYLSQIDFVPGQEPYEHLTTIEIEPAGDRTNVVMTVDPLHDENWTQDYCAHRSNELDKLEAAISRRTATHRKDAMENLSIVFTAQATPQDVFAAITNVRGWWYPGEITGVTDKLDEAFTYRYEDAHRCTQRMTELVPGKRVAWHVEDSYLDFVADKSEWTGTDITFDLAPVANGTEVKFTHVGLKPTEECYQQCSGAWRFAVYGNLRKLIAGA